MTRGLASSGLAPEGAEALGDHEVRWVARPFAGEAPGGDMFRLALGLGGALFFALGDAAGHGADGARFWSRNEAAFDHGWEGLLSRGDLEELVDSLDLRLAASGEPEDHLCLTLGRWEQDGRLSVVTCGYGTHALVRTARGPWWAEPEALFGLKLGWLGPSRRKPLPRGFVCNHIEAVDRVVLVSDGLLEDDHRDPARTLAGLAAANRRIAGLALCEVPPALLADAPDPAEDDVTLVAVERLNR